MKKFILLLTAIVVSCFLYPTSVKAENIETTVIYANCDMGLNIRVTPGMSFDPIDTVEDGTELEKIEESVAEGWTRILYEGEERYVYTNFTTEEAPITEPEQILTYFGVCTITHYDNGPCCCGQWAYGPTASGVYPTAGRTVAHNYLPFGTRVLINGIEYVVEDRGDSNMSSGMWFDIYVSSHSEANARGMYSAEVYIIN